MSPLCKITVVPLFDQSGTVPSSRPILSPLPRAATVKSLRLARILTERVRASAPRRALAPIGQTRSRLLTGASPAAMSVRRRDGSLESTE